MRCSRRSPLHCSSAWRVRHRTRRTRRSQRSRWTGSGRVMMWPDSSSGSRPATVARPDQAAACAHRCRRNTTRTSRRLSLLWCDAGDCARSPSQIGILIIVDPMPACRDGSVALKRDFGASVTFMGGLDTIGLIPRGTEAEVRPTTRAISSIR
ncbi:MAG: hypothetical protein MZV64_49255 [Ignavibacteriales bacterium]|nr:hypothetical protein [Ignavibacteriales bacterium]